MSSNDKLMDPIKKQIVMKVAKGLYCDKDFNSVLFELFDEAYKLGYEHGACDGVIKLFRGEGHESSRKVSK